MGTNQTGTPELHLVTGGAGFIGSHVVDELLSAGKKVRVLDNFSTGIWHNLETLKNAELLHVFEGDITNRFDVESAMEGVTHVYHLAAKSSVQESKDNVSDYVDANILGTVTMLEAAKNACLKKFVFASSASIYGELKNLPAHEDSPKTPANPYAVTKLAGEMLCENYRTIHLVPTTSLRLFNVFGPRQRFNGEPAVVPRFITAILEGTQPIFYGDGSQTRDFIFVEAVARAFVIAGGSSFYGPINVCSGIGRSINGLLYLIADLCGTGVNPIIQSSRTGDIQNSYGDESKMRRYLGIDPNHFRQNLMTTVNYYRGERCES